MIVTSIQMVADEKAIVTIQDVRVAPCTLFWLGREYVEGEIYYDTRKEVICGKSQIESYKKIYYDGLKKIHNKDLAA